MLAGTRTARRIAGKEALAGLLTTCGAGHHAQGSAPLWIGTVQIFDGGRRVPAGSASPAITNEFSAEVAEAEQQARGAGLSGFEKPAVPATCTYGAFAFRCIVYSAATGNGRVYGKLLLTGYRDNFVKIIAEWSQADSATLADADRALQPFVPAMMQ